MFEKSSSSRHKNELPVTVTLTGQDAFEASVFLKVDERLIDLLNDERMFIPIKSQGGKTVIVSKANIVSIIETGAHTADASDSKSKRPKRGSFDPYEVLRVNPGASLHEIRSAYKARMKTVHPDSVAALDLDEDLTKAAVLATQKVNHAYQQIIRDREQSAMKGADEETVDPHP